MLLSVLCIIVDILSVTPVLSFGVINPFWKFAFVFKCFTDSIILDDFKAALDKLGRRRMTQIAPLGILADSDDTDTTLPRGFSLGVSQDDSALRRSQGGILDTRDHRA